MAVMTEFIVIRFAPGAKAQSSMDGVWIDTSRIGPMDRDAVTAVANPTGRYERRADGVFAEIYEVEPAEPMATITAKELKSLRSDSDWLGWLESAGVDNWSGYDEAHALRRAHRKRHMGDPL